jgi:hypothetical protein
MKRSVRCAADRHTRPSIVGAQPLERLPGAGAPLPWPRAPTRAMADGDRSSSSSSSQRETDGGDMSARAGVHRSSIPGFGEREGGGAARDLEKEGQTAGIGEQSRSKFSLL